MSIAWLLLPEFLLIGCGWALCRYTALNRSIWDGVEKLVYYLLFPTLLFTSALRSPLKLTEDFLLVVAAVAVSGLGVVLAYALGCGPPWTSATTPAGHKWPFGSIPTWRWQWPNGWPAPWVWHRLH